MDIDKLKAKVAAVDVEAAALELSAWIQANIEKFIDNHRKEFLLSFSAKGMESMPELRKIESLFDEADIADGGVDVMNALSTVGGSITDKQYKEMADLVKRFENGEKIDQQEVEVARELIFSNDNWASKISDEELASIKATDAVLDILEGCCERVQEALEANREAMAELFARLVYYYEVRGFRDGILVESVMDGYVKVSNFCYDPYEMPIKVTPKTPKVDENGDFVLDENDNIIVEVGEPHTIVEPAGFNLDLSIEYWEKKTPTSIF